MTDVFTVPSVNRITNDTTITVQVLKEINQHYQQNVFKYDDKYYNCLKIKYF